MARGRADVLRVGVDVGGFRALQRVRGAGPALVDEQDVALAMHAIEGRGVVNVESGGRGARPAGDHRQRVGLGRHVQRRHDGDVQLDVAALRRVRIFRHRHMTASRGCAACAAGILEPARRQDQRRRRGRRGGEPGAEQRRAQTKDHPAPFGGGSARPASASVA